MDGVTSTSTDAGEPGGGVVVHTARVGILQMMVAPCAAVQLPEPLVTFAGAVDARPVVGTVALKMRRLAVWGPGVRMSEVNAPCVPAATGVGDGLALDAGRVSPLLAPILLTK